MHVRYVNACELSKVPRTTQVKSVRLLKSSATCQIKVLWPAVMSPPRVGVFRISRKAAAPVQIECRENEKEKEETKNMIN